MRSALYSVIIRLSRKSPLLRPTIDLENGQQQVPKLTTKLVLSTTPTAKDIILRDTEIKGFLCKITPKGKRVYMLYYRTKDFRERKPVIGYQGAINCDQAREIAKLWQAEILQGGDPSKDKADRRTMATVTDLSKRYMKEHANLKKKPSSISNDERMWKLHILPQIGSYKVSAVTKEDIAKLHNAMSENPITANRCRSLISKAFNLAELWGYRREGTNPCRHIKKYAETKRDRYLSLEEISTLSVVLNTCEADKTVMPSAVAAIRLLMLTGCRLSEILTLEWQHVDLKNHILNLPDSKTGAKKIHLSPPAVTLLQILCDDPNKCADNPYVIIGREPNSRLINLHKPWSRIQKLANIKDVRLHDLRHTFASIAVANGLSLPVIGALLGHSQVSTTARYAHLDKAPLTAAVNLIGDAISKAMQEKKDNS